MSGAINLTKNSPMRSSWAPGKGPTTIILLHSSNLLSKFMPLPILSGLIKVFDGD